MLKTWPFLCYRWHRFSSETQEMESWVCSSVLWCHFLYIIACLLTPNGLHWLQLNSFSRLYPKWFWNNKKSLELHAWIFLCFCAVVCGCAQCVRGRTSVRSVLWFSLGLALTKLVAWSFWVGEGGCSEKIWEHKLFFRVNGCDVGVRQTSDSQQMLRNEVFLQTPVWAPHVMPLLQR